MKPKYFKFILARMGIEIAILILVYVAFDELTSPSEATRSLLLDAVNKKLLPPAPFVEVTNVIHAVSNWAFFLRVIGLAALFLLSTDLWLVWRGRREMRSPG